MDGMDGLEMEELVLVCEELEPYVLEFQPGPEVDGSVEAFALAVMRRAEGVLLAMPCDSLPSEVLESGNQEDTTGVFGPSTTITVPGVVQDNGVQSQTGEDVQVLIIDCGRGVVSFLRPIGIDEELDFGFSVDQPMTLPSSDGLLAEAEKWVSSISGRPNFYTAESAAESPVEGTRAVPLPKRPPRRTGRGEGLPSAKKDARPKRVTTAALAFSVESLISAIPRLTDQLQVLADRQQAIEDQVAGAPLPPRAQLARPLGEAFSTPQKGNLGALARSMSPAPRTAQQPSMGLLAPLTGKPEHILELEDEKGKEAPDQTSLAKAVLAQSQALTTLVSQIAAAGQDPMNDLAGTGSSTSTRGAQGRARLQAELARHQGTFYLSVLQQMARRMAPTSVAEVSPMELVERGITGTRYLERFGGYGRMKEWGQLQYQVMTALDYLMQDNILAAKDTIALLAVTIEQGVLDQGRLEIASLLCLQEDVPAGVFMQRQVGATSRARSFAPLADQRWITCALAFLKEMDVITSKRLEFTAGGGGKASTTAPEDAHPKAKVKGAAKVKGKGKKTALEEEEAWDCRALHWLVDKLMIGMCFLVMLEPAVGTLFIRLYRFRLGPLLSRDGFWGQGLL